MTAEEIKTSVKKNRNWAVLGVALGVVLIGGYVGINYVLTPTRPAISSAGTKEVVDYVMNPRGLARLTDIEQRRFLENWHQRIATDEATRKELTEYLRGLDDKTRKQFVNTMVVRLKDIMRFARETPTQSVRALVVAADELAIPVGAANEEATLAATLTDDARVIALMPYMRARGVGVTLDIAQPSQDTQRLLDAPAYDYRWQIRYRLKEPLPLAAGTRLELTGKYDNSIGNLNNPDATVPGINGVDADEEALMLVLEIIEPIDLNESDE